MVQTPESPDDEPERVCRGGTVYAQIFDGKPVIWIGVHAMKVAIDVLVLAGNKGGVTHHLNLQELLVRHKKRVLPLSHPF